MALEAVHVLIVYTAYAACAAVDGPHFRYVFANFREGSLEDLMRSENESCFLKMGIKAEHRIQRSHGPYRKSRSKFRSSEADFNHKYPDIHQGAPECPD